MRKQKSVPTLAYGGNNKHHVDKYVQYSHDTKYTIAFPSLQPY
jgi:hypothetical protein